MYTIGCWLFVCISPGVGCLYVHHRVLDVCMYIIRCWAFVPVSLGVGCLYIYHRVLDVCTQVIGCFFYICHQNPTRTFIIRCYRCITINILTLSVSRLPVCHQVIVMYMFVSRCILYQVYHHVCYQVYNHMFVLVCPVCLLRYRCIILSVCLSPGGSEWMDTTGV